jgi:hypothetical protein
VCIYRGCRTHYTTSCGFCKRETQNNVKNLKLATLGKPTCNRKSGKRPEKAERNPLFGKEMFEIPPGP